MKYPVMIDGELCGSGEMTKAGAMTVIEVRCRMMEGIVRVSAYGESGEGYLGVLAPKDGELVLKKSFSPSAMRAFPGEIVEISRAGAGRSTLPEAEAAEKAQAAEAAEKSEENTTEAAEDSTRTEECVQPPEETAQPAEELPAAKPETVPEESGLNWYSSPDGALVCFDGEHSLVALPEGDGRIPKDIKGQEREIEGRKYLVYATQNCEIIR